MATNRIYISEPEDLYFEFACSQDGTFEGIGPWQSGPENVKRSFTSLPNGEDFKTGESYIFYIRDEDPELRNPVGYDFIAEVVYEGINNSTNATGDLQQTTNAGRHTTRIIDAASIEFSELETIETAEVLLAIDRITYVEGGQTYTRDRVKKVLGSSDPAPIAPEIPDQLLFTGDDYSWSFPAFQYATHYALSGLPQGISITDLGNRRIGGKVMAPVTVTAVITGYSATKATNATVRFVITERIATVTFGTIYAARNSGASGQLSIYALSVTNGAVMRMRIDDGEYRNLTTDPAGYARPDIFEGVAPLGSLYLNVPDGEHDFTFDIVGSGLDPVTVTALVAGGIWSKRLYPAEENLFLNMPVTQSGGVGGTAINNGSYTDALVATGTEPAAGGFLINEENPLPPKVKFVRIWPYSTSDPAKRQSIAGAWLMLAPDGAIGKLIGLEENLNASGVKKVQLPSPIPAGDYLDFQMDDFVAGMNLLQSPGNADMYLQEVEVFGVRQANKPPVLVTPFEEITVDEGSSGEKVVSSYFTDPEGGSLQFRGGLNGNVAIPGWMEVAQQGVLKWTDAQFTPEKVGDTIAYYPLNIFAKDPFNAETPGAIAFRVRQKDTVSGIEFAGYHYDIVSKKLTPQLRVSSASGSWAINLRALDGSWSASGIGTTTGSYTTEKQVSYNKQGTHTAGPVLGESYEAEFYQPGTTVKLTRTFTLVAGGGNITEQLYPTASQQGAITGAFVDEAILKSQYKILPRFRATSAVTYRIVRVGGGVDSGILPTGIPLDKDYYEGTLSAELPKGTYTITATLVADPLVTRAINVDVVKITASVTIDILFPRNTGFLNFDIQGKLIVRAPGNAHDGEELEFGIGGDRLPGGASIINAMGIAATGVSAGGSTGIFFYRNAASFTRFLSEGGSGQIALELKIKKKSGTMLGPGIWTSISFFSGGIAETTLANGVDFYCTGEVVSATKTYPANVSNVNLYAVSDTEATIGFYVLDLVNFNANFYPGVNNPLSNSGTIGPTFAGTLVKNGTECNPGFFNVGLLSYANGRFRLNDSANPSPGGLVVRYLIDSRKFYEPPLSSYQFPAGLPLVIQKFMVDPNTDEWKWTKNPPDGAGDRSRNDEITLLVI